MKFIKMYPIKNIKGKFLLQNRFYNTETLKIVSMRFLKKTLLTFLHVTEFLFYNLSFKLKN